MEIKQVTAEYRDNLDLWNRKYTITHDDETGELCVTIGASFASDRYDSIRDEVILQWVDLDGAPTLVGKVLVSGEGITDENGLRKNIFYRELQGALTGVVQADEALFERQPKLLAAPVLIYFQEGDEGMFYRYALTEPDAQ